MGTVNVTWALPAVDAKKQRPLKLVRVELSADNGANYVALAPVAANAAQTSRISDVDAGDYRIRLTVVDSADVAGPAVVTPFAVPFAAPGAVVNVQVAVS